ncbi:MAG: hypothetical protein AB1898_30480 [Acidobacteriota bacterium]
MDQVRVSRKTTLQSYGELYDAFLQLKSRIDPTERGWSSLKLAALTMAAFAIEAFANHVGQHLFQSWKHIERGMSPMGKLRMFIEALKIEMKHHEAPFNTVHELMKWRNQVAHGTTVGTSSSQMASPDTYDEVLRRIEVLDWKKYVFKVDIETVQKDCLTLMEQIHKKAFGNLHWFMAAGYHVGSAAPE